MVSNNILFLIALVIISLGFVLVYCFTTSPLSSYVGSDSAMFRLMGQGMVHGLFPYRDLFDHKGPVLFFIQYLGQMIKYGREGIFIIEWINLFLCLLLAVKIMNNHRIRNIWITMIGLGGFIWLAAPLFEGGNLTEEYSLLPLLLSIFLFTSCCNSETEGSKTTCYKKFSLIYGLCFGWISLIRINNTALICVIMLLVCIDQIKNKNWLDLLLNLLLFLSGVLLIVFPVCLFLMSKNLLKEMISSYFLFSLNYSSKTGMIEHIRNTFSTPVPFLLFLIPIIAVFLRNQKNKTERYFLGLGTLITIFSVVMGNNYLHYYTLVLPLIILSFACIIQNISFTRPFQLPRMIPVFIFFMILGSQYSYVYGSSYRAYQYIVYHVADEERDNAVEILNKIPEIDRNSVYGYNIGAGFYLNTETFPCFKYFCYQNLHISVKPSIEKEMLQFFENTPAKWLVLPTEDVYIPEELEKTIRRQYVPYGSNASYQLLSLKEE